VDIDGDGVLDTTAKLSEDHGSFVERMIEVLRHSPLLRLPQNRTVSFAAIRPPAKTLSLSAEAVVKNGADKPVAIVFGPENGAVSEPRRKRAPNATATSTCSASPSSPTRANSSTTAKKSPASPPPTCKRPPTC
jgi:hypothetical protein